MSRGSTFEDLLCQKLRSLKIVFFFIIFVKKAKFGVFQKRKEFSDLDENRDSCLF